MGTATDRARGGVIVVGVDGSRAADAAVTWAAIEADRLECGLRLLHVIPMVALSGLHAESAGDALPKSDAALRHRRDRILGQPAKLARTILPQDRVTTDMVPGERVPELVSAAAQARAVVLGAPWHPRVDRLITGSVVGGVAARAGVPVVGVPEDWTSHQDQGRIVVAVKHPEGEASRRMVAQAIGIAASRKSRLTVLHSWEFPVVYDNMIATVDQEQEWTDVKRQSLEELVELAGGADSGVSIDVEVVHGQGAHAVVAAAADADLVIISRRRHAFPFGHLGAPGRTVLRESRCPVEVVPPLDPEPSRDSADTHPSD